MRVIFSPLNNLLCFIDKETKQIWEAKQPALGPAVCLLIPPSLWDSSLRSRTMSLRRLSGEGSLSTCQRDQESFCSIQLIQQVFRFVFAVKLSISSFSLVTIQVRYLSGVEDLIYMACHLSRMKTRN